MKATLCALKTTTIGQRCRPRPEWLLPRVDISPRRHMIHLGKAENTKGQEERGPPFRWRKKSISINSEGGVPVLEVTNEYGVLSGPKFRTTTALTAYLQSSGSSSRTASTKPK